jgi:hypothetical protein
MRASELLAYLRDRGVEPQARGGKLVLANVKSLPTWLLQGVSAHRVDLKAFVERGEDRELTPIVGQTELRRLGFIELPNGKWSHPRGDEIGNRILLGLVDPKEIDPKNTRTRDELNARGANSIPPRAERVMDLREVYPGRWRWSETEGHLHRDPFPKIQRLKE